MISTSAIISPQVRFATDRQWLRLQDLTEKDHVNYDIGPFCVIGEPCDARQCKRGGIPGHVVLFECTIQSHVTIDIPVKHGGWLPPDRMATTIGRGCLLMSHSHVGHGCVLQKSVVISHGASLAGDCYVGEGCNIGMGATLHQRSFVPDFTMIGAGAFYKTKESVELVRGLIIAGVPARPIGVNTVGLHRAKEAGAITENQAALIERRAREFMGFDRNG